MVYRIFLLDQRGQVQLKLHGSLLQEFGLGTSWSLLGFTVSIARKGVGSHYVNDGVDAIHYISVFRLLVN